ncbi:MULTISPECIES: ABC transporter ATP-binding protein [unclassified Exiguobacterium]|uniref:ABC transporter ATP-binding protein n=1 Tax=unclassified Exiguobacterium TaxID=2644629 RepID=UPI00068C01CD|nr:MULTISPECIES: ATP-binding cassette domain-containing protein [unclassified Exiguobacterium]AOT01749.1 transposase [Exiguobacterium sp. U13-1]HBQ77407.1 transposase [Exiguobacterium sp.]
MSMIKLDHVTKRFDMVTTTKEKFKLLFKNQSKSVKTFTALRDVSLEIGSGEVVGLVGINGSGKSTLSNLISGIIYANEGDVAINGEVAIIAVSQGLKNVLTGRENIRLKCLMLGMDDAEIERRMPGIIDFADIGDFIDQPIKKYSSGMKSRLGFAIAVNVDADILIVDEALSVGDQTFYNRCIDKMNEFKDEGKTIIFVSHSLSQIKSFCERVVWLEYGQVRLDGTTKDVLPEYKKFLAEYKKWSKEEQHQYRRDRLKEQAANARSGKENTDSEDTVKHPGWILSGLGLLVLAAGSLMVIDETPSLTNLSDAILNFF